MYIYYLIKKRCCIHRIDALDGIFMYLSLGFKQIYVKCECSFDLYSFEEVVPRIMSKVFDINLQQKLTSLFRPTGCHLSPPPLQKLVTLTLTCSCCLTLSFFWASVTRSSSLRRSSWLTPSLESSALASAWFSSCSSCSFSALPSGGAGTTTELFSSSLAFSRSSWADRACR